MLKLFSLIVLTQSGGEWVLDYNLTAEDCGQALVDFAQAEDLFHLGVRLTCEPQ